MKLLARFEDFESDFIKKNRSLLRLFIFSTLLSSVLLSLTLLKNEYYYFSTGKILKREMLLESFCLESFKNVTSSTPSPIFLKEEILNLVKADPFIIENSEILYLNDFKKEGCKLIIKTPSGLRSFIVNLDHSNLYPFNYKLAELIETQVAQEALP